MERSYAYYQHFDSDLHAQPLRPRKRYGRLCAESDDNPPSKQLITEERMAEHMKMLSIDQTQVLRTARCYTSPETNGNARHVYRDPFCSREKLSHALPTSNCSSDNEELVSLLGHGRKSPVPSIQLTPPTPVQLCRVEGVKSLPTHSIILEDFDSSEGEEEEGGGGETWNGCIQLTPEAQNHVEDKQKERIASAIFNSVCPKPCMEVVLWTPQERFVLDVLEKTGSTPQDTLPDGTGDSESYYDIEDDAMNMDT